MLRTARQSLTTAELASLCSRCRGEAAQIEQALSHISQSIVLVGWESADWRQFAHLWSGEFKPALERLREALDQLGGAAARAASR